MTVSSSFTPQPDPQESPSPRPPSEQADSTRREEVEEGENREIAAAPKVPAFRRGWAKGKREVFFNERASGYTAARARGHRKARDFVSDTINDYCLEFTWWIDPPHEPTSADLAKKDEDLDAHILELKPAKMERLFTGIRNLLDRLSNSADPLAKMSPTQIKKDPVGSLIAKIANAKVDIPRARTAYQLWLKHVYRSNVKATVDQTIIEDDIDAKSGRIGVIQGTTMEHFLALPASERQVWELRSEAEKKANAAARELIKQKGGVIPASTPDPETSQEVLDGLVHYIQPLLRGINILTGGNAHFIWAGPEPTRGGQVNVLSVHAGVDSSPAPHDFAEATGAEALARRHTVEAAFGDFALRCFNARQQAERALPGVAPCTAPPSFLCWRPASWQTGGILPIGSFDDESPPAPTVPTSGVAATPMAPMSTPTAPVPLPKSTKGLKRKKGPRRSQPRKRRSTSKGQSVQEEDDETTDDDEEQVEEREAPWAMDDDGSGDDELPSTGPRQPGTRGSARLTNRQREVPALQDPPEETTNTVSGGIPPAMPMNVDAPPTIDGNDEPIRSQSPVLPIEPTIESNEPTVTTPVHQDQIRSPSPVGTVAPQVITSADDSHDNLMDNRPAVSPPAMPKKLTRAKKVLPASPSTAKKTTRNSSQKTSEVPEYIQHIKPMFATVKDDFWTALVDKFLVREKSTNYANQRLRPGQRPPVILNWVASRRPQLLHGVVSDKFPSTTTLAKNEFWSWWRFLQPEWRSVQLSQKPLTCVDREMTGDDWAGLDATGTHGLVNVLVYLCMWGMKVAADGSGHAAWKDALVDVDWVFDQISA